MKWFKHDSNANMDAKLQDILLDYGLEGYGLYWYCIELIVNKIDADNLTFQLEHDCRIIARNTGSTVQKVQEMMTRFVDLGLFENSDGIITCHKLARRLDKSMTTNKEIRGYIEKLKVDNEDYSGYVYFVLATKGTERKIKIGRSKNPTSRLEELKRRKDTQGFNLSIIHKIQSDNCVALETSFHRDFKEINIENEWFLPSDDLLSYIDDLRHDVNSLRTTYDMQEENRKEEIRIDQTKEDKNKKKVSQKLDLCSWPNEPNNDLLKEWKQLRTKLKAPVSQTVINRMGKELTKAVQMGFTVDNCLEHIIYKGWRGFEADWLKTSEQKTNNSQYSDVTAHNIAVFENVELK